MEFFEEDITTQIFPIIFCTEKVTYSILTVNNTQNPKK